MKAVAYSIKPFEKEFLAKANQKKHDITLISNSLSLDTVVFSEGKKAVIVLTTDDVSAPVIEKLAKLGIKFIIAGSVGTDHIDKEAAASYNIKIANVPSYSCQPDLTNADLQETANQTIKSLDLWQQNRCLGDACICARNCDLYNND
ncbi:MAG: lactate dehydrogenase [Mucilaginibacter sp.]|nr:lactate dehydrogenase [Mucilaginibacter sp.]